MEEIVMKVCKWVCISIPIGFIILIICLIPAMMDDLPLEASTETVSEDEDWDDDEDWEEDYEFVGDEAEERRNTFQHTTSQAKKAAKQYLKDDVLDSPLTAVIRGTVKEEEVYIKNGDERLESFIFNGKVDHQNAFGTFVRTDTIIRIYFTKDPDDSTFYAEVISFN